jgi:hypothetical protein
MMTPLGLRTNHNDALSLRVLHELLQAIDEVGTVEGVPADSDASRLPKTHLNRGT